MAIDIGPGITFGAGISAGTGALLLNTFITTENNDNLITEAGDTLVTES